MLWVGGGGRGDKEWSHTYPLATNLSNLSYEYTLHYFLHNVVVQFYCSSTKPARPNQRQITMSFFNCTLCARISCVVSTGHVSCVYAIVVVSRDPSSPVGCVLLYASSSPPHSALSQCTPRFAKMVVFMQTSSCFKPRLGAKGILFPPSSIYSTRAGADVFVSVCPNTPCARFWISTVRTVQFRLPYPRSFWNRPNTLLERN